MASLKVYFICALLVLGVAAQKDKKKNAAKPAAKPAAGQQTRGHFGGFNAGHAGGFGNQGVGGAYRPGLGNAGLVGGRPHQGGFQQGGFGQGGFQQGGFQQGGFGQGAHQGNLGGGFRPGAGNVGLGGIGGYQPGVGGAHAGVGGLGGGLGGLGAIHAGIGGNANRPKPAQCRYWCKTPEGQAYCCESANAAPKPAISTQVVKPGSCPPVRPVCPLRNFGGPPQPCSNDGACAGIDRCCFDRCLSEHVCKPPQGYGK